MKIVGVVIIVFIVGMILGSFLTNPSLVKGQVAESPSSAIASEQNSPFDRINESQIHVYADRIVIDVKNPEWATFTDTNSMDPLLDIGANALQIAPETENDIHVGDIISYHSEYAEGTIIHRVKAINKDEEGIYFTVKGDNNPELDPGKIRFSQIKKVLIGVIY